MPTKWSSKKNGVKVGVAYDTIQTYADPNGIHSQAKLTSPRVLIDRDVNIVDTANQFVISGGAVVDVTKNNQNLSGSGQKTVFSVSPQNRELSAATHNAHFKCVAKNIDYAGADLTADDTITFPALAPFAAIGSIQDGSGTTSAADVSWWFYFLPTGGFGTNLELQVQYRDNASATPSPWTSAGTYSGETHDDSGSATGGGTLRPYATKFAALVANQYGKQLHLRYKRAGDANWTVTDWVTLTNKTSTTQLATHTEAA